ncbi:MAG: M48 family metallopeptidase, partial [Candidatus Kaiserbacteria bacterium]|nr:M48 family metallopeptidase [Candidatus Kaiserbacteria bacterium]
TRRRPRRRRVSHHTAHYNEHKERARILIHERLTYWNTFYNCSYNKVAIRNQSTRWGSCSMKRNLNFNYRIALLPQELMDYVIVHELCHLIEFNHSSAFWACMGRALPDHHERKIALQHVPMHTLHTEKCVL